ncbi:DUF2145 domain-containing protein [Pseudorhodoferax sp.]|uniref:DUF2145 domain-containing protein n=1 Tax=Pseudorhodoferax sp. TaxID=1993553 RepID=UPI001B54E7F0|nr:DUF2145 domain-containing protein [Pseudorhodoferax sp.]MBP8145301.1 DUF2145 domain-containing protein [Inhella sp.]
MRALRRWVWVLALMALTAPAVRAGRPCETPVAGVQAVVQGLGLAERTARALDASGAQVVVLARAGQDLSQWGLRWSHLAFAYREAPPDAATPGAVGSWRVLHKLNHCGSDHAALYRQGLAEFFLDDPHRYEAAYAVPSPELQQQLLPLLRDNARAAHWHQRRYNLLAYPWATAYQQSNQWLIETLAGAAEPAASDRPRAQAWLRLKGYQPTVLRIDAFKRLGARMTRANVAFDDHPSSQRFADRIATVSADSVFAWLQGSGLADGERIVR